MRLNDLDFHVEIDGSGPALVLLHGFTGSVRAWDQIRPKLTPLATVISIDLIGHGDSACPDDPPRYSLDWSVRDLSALLDALGLEAVDLLGYSMGGRVALYFGTHAPGRVRTLILESASPGIEDAAERKRRVDSDNALAEGLERDGIEAFVDVWERQPLLGLAPHVTSEERTRQHAQRLLNDLRGLANSLRGMGTGQQTPVWSHLADWQAPTFLIVGERDARYTQIAQCMRSLLPTSELAVVPEAGHTVHVDQPEAFVELVSAALFEKTRN
jgi:2-succinyl-6-hydroxy-2,4-cyclohexadiene-1-carboxylate synthase